MKKIYFVLILCVSSYGFSSSFLGVGSKSCSNYLDDVEYRNFELIYLFVSFAQGTFMTMNMFSESKIVDELGERYFDPDVATLQRVLTKHCEENLAKEYFYAVFDVWNEYAR